MTSKVITNEEELIAEIEDVKREFAESVQKIKADMDRKLAEILERKRLAEIEQIKKDIKNIN